MKTIFISTIITILISFAPKNKITGRWETKPNQFGNVTGVVFNKNNTYDVYVNKKPFVSGIYSIRRNIITFKEPGCDAKGLYTLMFFSNSDSLRFEPVNDSCTERKAGMLRTILGKVN